MNEVILDLCHDFYKWPVRWHGVKDDIEVGRRILTSFEPFVVELCESNLTKKTKKRHMDNLWLLGGEIVREVSTYDRYEENIERIVRESVGPEGGLSSHHLQTEEDIRSFNSTCRKLANYFGKSRIDFPDDSEDNSSMNQPTDRLLTISGFDPARLGRHAKGSFWAGIVSIVLGLAAIALPGLFTLGIDIFIGTLLTVAGVSQVIAALGSVGTRNWWLALLVGILTAVVGVLFLLDPFQGAAALTIVFGALFLVSGFFRLFYVSQIRGVAGTGWGILNAVISIIIGGIILAGWPDTSTFILGLFLGIDLLFFGLFLILFGQACRRAGEQAHDSPQVHRTS